MILKKLTSAQKGIIIHSLQLLTQLLFLFYFFLTYEDNEHQKAAFSWVAGEGVSGTIFHPIGKYIWITILLLWLIIMLVGTKMNLKSRILEEEDFDEEDERDRALKNVFYRRLNIIETSLLSFALIIFALYPNGQITLNTYNVGISIAIYLSLRSLLLLFHSLYRTYK